MFGLGQPLLIEMKQTEIIVQPSDFWNELESRFITRLRSARLTPRAVKFGELDVCSRLIGAQRGRVLEILGCGAVITFLQREPPQHELKTGIVRVGTYQMRDSALGFSPIPCMDQRGNFQRRIGTGHQIAVAAKRSRRTLIRTRAAKRPE